METPVLGLFWLTYAPLKASAKARIARRVLSDGFIYFTTEAEVEDHFVATNWS